MVTGILLLDKPLGLSSNGALQRVKRLLRADKAGHVGSLDPLASGMLPICLGEATKIAGEILSGRKRYAFTIALGSRTATGDVEGAITETLPVPAFDRASLDATLGRFLGAQTQIPPMYSAIKRDGQPLYKLARAGVEVERAPRRIEIFELTVVGFDDTTAAVTLWPPLTTVHQPVRDLAAEALRLLVAQASAPIAQARNTGVHLLEHKIVHRQSAARPSDAPIARADGGVTLPGATRGRRAAHTLPHSTKVG